MAKIFWVALVCFFLCFAYASASSASASGSGSGSGTVSGSGSGSGSGTGSGSGSGSGSMSGISTFSLDISISNAAASKSKPAASKSKPAASKSKAAASKSKAAASKSKAAASKSKAAASKSKAAASKSKAAASKAVGTVSSSNVFLPPVTNLVNSCKTNPRTVCPSWTDPKIERNVYYSDHEIAWRASSSTGDFSNFAFSGTETFFSVVGLTPSTNYTIRVTGIESSAAKRGVPAFASMVTAAVNTSSPLQNKNISLTNFACVPNVVDLAKLTYSVSCTWAVPLEAIPEKTEAKLKCTGNNTNEVVFAKINKKDFPGTIVFASWDLKPKKKASVGGVVSLTCVAEVHAFYRNSQNNLKADKPGLSTSFAIKN